MRVEINSEAVKEVIGKQGIETVLASQKGPIRRFMKPWAIRAEKIKEGQMNTRKLRLVVPFAVFCLSVFLVFFTVPAEKAFPAPPAMIEEMVPMRDGVQLYTRVYLPDPDIWGPGPYPTIVSTTPYRIGTPGEPPNEWPEHANRGYAFVNQDHRGRYASEGVWTRPNDGKDGYDTIEWAAAQPWCNGKIGMTGGSALGIATYQTAAERPQHLVAIMPSIASADSQNNSSFQGGALKWETLLGWVLYMMPGLSQSHIDSLGMEPEQIAFEKMINLIALSDVFSHMSSEPGKTPMDSQTWMTLPLTDVPGVKLGGFWDDYMANYSVQNEYRDAYNVWSTIDVPALHVGGWYDLFSRGTLEAFVKIRGNDVPHQKMFMTYGHHMIMSYLIPVELTYRWFDYWLKEIDTGIMDEPAVQYYLMGAEPGDEWRTAEQWPPEGVEYATYYLHDDGVLNTEFPCKKEGSVTYLYDPNDPVLSYGGRNLFFPAGAVDQSPVEPPNRDDVLVYRTAVLEDDVVVTGNVKVVLHASSDARDTDFTAKLIDVHPDGSAINILDDVIRARFRESQRYEVFMEPRKVYEFTIDLGDTAQVFKAGHRIQVDISSSNFPCKDRNTNTGNPLYVQDTAADVVTARNTIYHDLFHRSYVVLPIMNGNTKTLHASLGDDHRPSRLDQDVYEFSGTKGERIAIRLDADPWKEGMRRRATLLLMDKMRKVRLCRIDGSELPNVIKVRLPATGDYSIMVAEQPGRKSWKKYRGDYSLTLEASLETCRTFQPTRWVE